MIDTSKTTVSRTEIIVSDLLRWGVGLSLLLILLGVALMFARHPDYFKAGSDVQRLTTPGAAFPHSLAEEGAGLLALQGRAVVVLGLLTLIATPIVRVAVSIIAFAIDGDWTYVVITSVVLAVLLLSFFLGRATM